MYTYLGSVTVGGLLPGAAALHGQLVGKIQADLAAAISANVSLRASLGVNLTDNISAAVEAVLSGRLLLSLQATLAVDVQAGIQASLAANVALIAALQASLEALLAIGFGTGGLHAYALAGRADGAPADASSALSALPGAQPGDLTRALIVATTSPAAWEALAKLVLTA